ncbi:hypothetical protein [Lactococcus protaetiae]|uniref:RiboL-PSP-HEPN domain-containing protein n=1 Tax=Lactococcus protaetiae TaxID=2592653 RepID=A0A514Z5M6_9LACT|nr:hypothetical protein [Lactococcus protaetiae]QDK69894.1 hypothetical protein FLP15_00320 [Lactococcus protaetiae]
MVDEQDERYDLFQEIEKWKNLIQNNPEIIELAFFKIFVKFENLYTKMIPEYAIGNSSKLGKHEKLKMQFSDYDHLKKMTNVSYFEINSRMKIIVEQIFEKDNCFELIQQDSEWSFFQDCKYLRNFIAHESDEAKREYISHSLHHKDFLEPKDYLLKKNRQKGGQSNYDRFVKMIKNFATVLVEEQE